MKYFLTPLLLICCFGLVGGSTAESGLADDIRQDVKTTKNKVTGIANQTAGLKNRVVKVKRSVDDMKKALDEGRDLLDENLRAWVKTVSEEGRALIEEEMAGYGEFKGSSDERALRSALRGLLADGQALANSLLAQVPTAGLGDCPPEVSPLTVDFARIDPLIQKIPTSVLYVIHRALELTDGLLEQLADRLHCAIEIVRELSALAGNATDEVRENVVERPDLYRSAAAALHHTAQLTTFVATLLEKIPQGKVVNVAIWGWAGGSIPLGAIAKHLALALNFIAPHLNAFADRAHERVADLEQEHFRMTVLENQRKLLRQHRRHR